MRLLVCVAQAALDGPLDEGDWESCQRRLVPASLNYLDRHRSAFDLYAQGDEGAFLQVPNLEPTGNAVVDKLDFGLAAGNNATLFDHQAGPEGRDMSQSWQALGLLTYQCFSPGGMIGVTRWNGVWMTTDGKSPKGPGASEHAPCLDGGPLHTIVRARDLTATIHANLLTKKIVSELPSLEWGRPVWETRPSSAADPHATALVSSYLGRLVPIARAVRLSPTSRKITMCNGLSYPKFPETREPSCTVVSKKDGTPAYLRIDLHKHPWRELASLLSASPSRTEGRALVLDHLRRGADGTVDIWTGGLAADKGKVLDVAEWSFRLPLSMLGAMELQTYERGVELANKATRSLWAAVSAYCDDLKLSEAKTKQAKNARASTFYWSSLDSRYAVLMGTIEDPAVKLGEAWYQEVWRALNAAYAQACPHETPRQIRAYAKGNQMLRLKQPEG
jgi:CRISPR system Cascade subunit CasA